MGNPNQRCVISEFILRPCLSCLYSLNTLLDQNNYSQMLCKTTPKICRSPLSYTSLPPILQIVPRTNPPMHMVPEQLHMPLQSPTPDASMHAGTAIFSASAASIMPRCACTLALRGVPGPEERETTLPPQQNRWADVYQLERREKRGGKRELAASYSLPRFSCRMLARWMIEYRESEARRLHGAYEGRNKC
jgi:hypothetical protein